MRSSGTAPSRSGQLGLKIDLHMTDVPRALLAARDNPAGAPRTWRASGSMQRGVRQLRTLRCSSSTVLFFGSFERFIGILIEHTPGAFPFWLAPVQILIIPVGEDHRVPAGVFKGQPGIKPGRGRRAGRDRGEAHPRRRDREDPLRDRLWGQGRSEEGRHWRCGGGVGSSRLSAWMPSVRKSQRLLTCRPASRSAHVPHLASLSSAWFNRVEGRGFGLLRAAALLFTERIEFSLVIAL